MEPAATPIALATALREDARFLRALARSLVHDEQLADDVVQEAWIAVLLRQPRDAGSWRGWLAAIVRNLSFRERRTQARRSRREEAVAAPERLDDTPAAVVARGELQQLLATAVMELPEAQRQVVLLRYFDGLSAVEIARRRGIPDATVRTHLKRALDRLRERLDAGAIGGRAAWLALLAPWAELVGPNHLPPVSPPPPPNAPSLPSSAAAPLASSSTSGWKLASGTLLFASGAALLWTAPWRDSPPLLAPPDLAAHVTEPAADEPPPRADLPAVRSEATGDRAAPAALARAVETSELARLLAAPLGELPPAVVRGRLLRTDGTPASGAELTFTPLDELGGPFPGMREVVADSDADGAFRIEGLDFEPPWLFTARLDEFAIERRVELLPGLNDFGVLLQANRSAPPPQEPALRALARVVDVHDAPIENARVTLRSLGEEQPLRSDGTGAVELPLPFRSFAGTVAAFGFTALEFDFDEPPLPLARFVLPSSPTRRLEVVEGGERTVVPGTRLVLLGSSEVSSTAAPTHEARLRLGAPDQESRVRRESDRRGFRIALVPEEGERKPQYAAAWAPGFAVRLAGPFDPDRDAARSELLLPRSALLAVRLEDEAGVPVVGATVLARARGEAMTFRARPENGLLGVLPPDALAYAISDVRGCARLFGVAHEATELEVRVEGRAPTRVELDALESSERSELRARGRFVAVTLRRGGTVAGSARRSDGTPLVTTWIRLEGADRLARFTVTDRDGRFRFEEVVVGAGEVRVGRPTDPVVVDGGDSWLTIDANGNRGRKSKAKLPDPWGGRPKPAPFKVQAGTTATVDLVEMAEATGRIGGRVTLGERPLAGAAILLVRRLEDGSVALLAEQPRAVCDGAGRFEFDSLPAPSVWSVSVPAAESGLGSGYEGQLATRDGLALAAGGKLELEVAVPTQPLRGVVRDAASGAPLPGVAIELRSEADRASRRERLESRCTITSDAAGCFERDELLAGRCFVRVFAPGWLPLERDIELHERTNVRLELRPGGWVRLLPGERSRFAVAAVHVVQQVGPRAVVEPIEYDRPRASDGTFWLFAGDPAAPPGHLGGIAPGFEPFAELFPLDAEGRRGSAKRVQLPVQLGEPVVVPLDE